jgi:GMP synthase-like glutamine amidotransferase
MEGSSNNYLEFVSSDERYNIIKHVHLFFYKQEGENLEFLLYKERNSLQDDFRIISSELDTADNVPTTAVARLMTTKFQGLFSEKNLKIMASNSKLNENDLDTDVKWYDLYVTETYKEWLGRMSNNPIQLDTIKSNMVYFMELNENIPYYNENLQSLNYPFEFKFFSVEEILKSFPSKNSSFIYNLFSQVNIPEFISTIAAKKKNDELPYYLVFGCTPCNGEKDQGGYFHFPSLFMGLYRRNNEKWLFYGVSTDELPDDTILSKTKAILIPGSAISVYGDYPFLSTLKSYLKEKVFVEANKIKVLGICFGAQLISEALGGKVTKLLSGKFVSGKTKVEVNDEFWELPFVKTSKVEKKQYLEVTQAHGDEISVLAPGYKIFGWSETCEREVMFSDDGKVFMVQGHPEYDMAFVMARLVESQIKMRNLEKTEENRLLILEEGLKENQSFDKWPLREICYSFLKR